MSIRCQYKFSLLRLELNQPYFYAWFSDYLCFIITNHRVILRASKNMGDMISQPLNEPDKQALKNAIDRKLNDIHEAYLTFLYGPWYQRKLSQIWFHLQQISKQLSLF